MNYQPPNLDISPPSWISLFLENQWIKFILILQIYVKMNDKCSFVLIDPIHSKTQPWCCLNCLSIYNDQHIRWPIFLPKSFFSKIFHISYIPPKTVDELKFLIWISKSLFLPNLFSSFFTISVIRCRYTFILLCAVAH